MIDMKQSLIDTVKGIHLCPGVDVEIETYDPDGGFAGDPSITVSVFWHRPSLNLGIYPICQIDIADHFCAYHREGAENPEHWDDLLIGAAEFIRDYV